MNTPSITKPADAVQQHAQLINELKAATMAAEANARAYAAKAAKAEQDRDTAEHALQQARKENDQLRNTITPTKDESPFVQVGKISYLISSIHTIAADFNGNTAFINGRDCGSNTMPAKALENRVAEYHKNRRAAR